MAEQPSLGYRSEREEVLAAVDAMVGRPRVSASGEPFVLLKARPYFEIQFAGPDREPATRAVSWQFLKDSTEVTE